MIKPFFIRSTLFNLCFYVLTGISCVVLLPTLLLPRPVFMAVVHAFVFITACLEKYILGLNYEVRGLENLPDSAPFIVAAKHQSAYETFKLHILFNDPAIVLKKELLKIPLWGKYLAKSDVIAIDRSSPKAAIKSIQEGAQRMAKQGREIIIFPQGTRVSPDTTALEKPYKIGIIRIQEATGLPIIPMALNTGVFYPRNSWCKRPGRVVFEFLPPITPSDAPAGEKLKHLEMRLEEKSARLVEEGKACQKQSKAGKVFFVLGLLLALLYSVNWFVSAHFVKKSIQDFMTDLSASLIVTDYVPSEPHIYGFPGKLQVSLPAQTVDTIHGHARIERIHAESWPLMGMPIKIETGPLTMRMPQWKDALEFDHMKARIRYKGETLTILSGALRHNQTHASVKGSVTFTPPYPHIDLALSVQNYEPMLLTMVDKNIVKEKPAMFAGIALGALQKDGVISTHLSSQDNKVYLGPIKILEFPKAR